jgi:hypothetical protein
MPVRCTWPIRCCTGHKATHMGAMLSTLLTGTRHRQGCIAHAWCCLPPALCPQSFATWKQHHEDLQVEKAVSHDYRRHSARALVAWQLGTALIHRKRSLIAAAVQLVKKHRQQHSLSTWMRYTYYKHIGHVVLHFRVRRMACVVLREWQEVGGIAGAEGAA